MSVWNWICTWVDTSSSCRLRPTTPSQRRRAFFEPLEERRVLAVATLAGGASSSWTFSDTNSTSNGLPSGGNLILAADGAGAGIDDASIAGQSDAFDSAAQLWVNNTIVGGALTANAPHVSFAPSVIAGLNVNLSYYLAANSATVRVLLTLSNPTASAITVPVDYASNFGSDGGTAVQATSSGDTTFTAADRWLVTDDGSLSAADPANTTVLFGPFTPTVTPTSVSQTVFSASGTQGVLANYNVTVPAGASRSLMFFQKLNTTSALATSEAPTLFDTNPVAGSDLVAGLAASRLARIVNWNFGNFIENVVADAGGIYSVNEGGNVVVSAANSFYPDGTITSYEWDLDNNGSYETTGISPTFSAAGIDGPATRTVGLRVTSSDGEFGFDTATVFVNNVAPALALGLSDNTISENDSTTLTGTITDPGPGETFTLDLHWGDPLSPMNTQFFTLGTAALTVAADGIDWNPATGIFSLPHQYRDDNPSSTTSDNYTVTATVADNDTLPRVLFVSDSDTDLTIPAALGNFYDITVATRDFANGNAALLGDLSSYAAVLWSATGTGTGAVTSAAVITNLTNYVTAGGNVFVTGYDSLASPVDANLIAFVGGTGATDTSALPNAVANLSSSLTTGLVDIRNVVPANSYSDLDAISGLSADTVGIVSSSSGFQWTLRTLGAGEIAYVSNGAVVGDSFDNWLVTTPMSDAVYNAALRNFVLAATPTDAIVTTEQISLQVSNIRPIAAAQDATATESGTLSPTNVLAGLTDVGTLDTHTAVADSGITPGFNIPYTVATDGTVTYDMVGRFESIPGDGIAFDEIFFTIVDDDGGTSINSVTIRVFGENDAPTLAAQGFTIPENSPNAMSVGIVVAGDVDFTDTKSFAITAGNGNGAFAINPTTGEITVANSALLNFEATPSIPLTVSVTDPGNLTASNTVTITLSDVVEPVGVTVSPTAGLTTSEAGGTATFTIALASQPTADVTIGLTSSNLAEGTVAPGSVTFTSLNWNVPQTITVTGVNDLLDDGDVAYTIATGAANTADVAYNNFNPADVSLTNLDNDSTPMISEIADQTTNEETSLNDIPFTVGDAETPAGSLTVTATSSDTALFPEGSITLGGSGADRTISLSPATNLSGDAMITVTVDDGAGGTASTTFTVQVNAVNDEPTLDPITNIPTLPPNSGAQTINLTGITAGGGESQTLAVTATSSNPALIPNPSLTYTSPGSTGSLRFTPVSNQSGSATITVTVTDNGGTANGGVNTFSRTFTVTVEPPLTTPRLVAVVPDPENPGQGLLVVNGTSSLDLIMVLRVGNRTFVSVPLSGVQQYFDTSSFGRVLINGLAGDDRIILHPNLEKPATINGDAGDDFIMSGAGNDSIRGGAGSDFIFGRAGNDFIYGEAGADYIYGEAGNDVVLGGQNNDWLSGGAGADILNGGAGLDTILGDGGDDLIVSGNFTHANSAAELLAIQAIWTSGQPFSTRVNSLASRVNPTTVTSDGQFDWIFTGLGRDWAVDYAWMDLLLDFNFNPAGGDKRN